MNIMSNTTTQPAFPGFFRASDSSQPCSIEAALRMSFVQPDEDPACLFIPGRGKLPYTAAVSMGLIDKVAAAAIKAHDNVNRMTRGVIEYIPPAPPKGPMADHEGTPAGAVAAALQSFVASRSDEDLAGFARALEVALAGR
jgi:hypothetical protein